MSRLPSFQSKSKSDYGEILHSQRLSIVEQWNVYFQNDLRQLLPDLEIELEYSPGFHTEQGLMQDLLNQHQKDILVAYKGEYKLNPELGVGIDVLLKEDDVTAILIEAKKNLMYDGVDVKNIYFSDQAKLIIDGKYIK